MKRRSLLAAILGAPFVAAGAAIASQPRVIHIEEDARAVDLVGVHEHLYGKSGGINITSKGGGPPSEELVAELSRFIRDGGGKAMLRVIGRA
jgi:hypothetical protein